MIKLISLILHMWTWLKISSKFISTIKVMKNYILDRIKNDYIISKIDLTALFKCNVLILILFYTIFL